MLFVENVSIEQGRSNLGISFVFELNEALPGGVAILAPVVLDVVLDNGEVLLAEKFDEQSSEFDHFLLVTDGHSV